MKRIGIIGGLSWVSTMQYYRLINVATQRRLGNYHSSDMVIVSLDFDKIVNIWANKDYLGAKKLISKSLIDLQAAGAEVFLIASESFHDVIEDIDVQFPFVNIGESLAKEIGSRNIRTIGVFGTRDRNLDEFYAHFFKKYNIRVITPNFVEQEIIDKCTSEDMCAGTTSERLKTQAKTIANSLISRGAEGILLGWNENENLFEYSELVVPLFRTLEMHAEAAVSEALSCEFLPKKIHLAHKPDMYLTTPVL